MQILQNSDENHHFDHYDDHYWTFVSIKVFLRIVRSSRLRQRIDMILKKPPNAYNVFQKCFLQKFWNFKVSLNNYEPLESQIFFLKFL